MSYRRKTGIKLLRYGGMDNMENTLKILIGEEVKIIFGCGSKNYILPKFKLPQELVSDSLEKHMPFSSGIMDVNMKPNDDEELEKHIKEQTVANRV